MKRLVERAKKHRSLIENFSYLSALHAFNLLFPLLTYPYLIRVLGAETYGRVIFAQGITAYVAVLVNFGFQSSAPRDVAVLRGNVAALSELVSSIFLAKLGLTAASLAALVALVELVPSLTPDRWLYYVTFGSTATPLLVFDWYFQGIEKMRNIALVQFVVRVLSVAGIFAFIRGPGDGLRLAALNSGAAILGGLLGLIIVHRHGIRLSLQPSTRVRAAVERSAPLFLANVFAAVADKTGTLVVGSALGPVALSYYNLGEKLTSFGAMVFFNVGRAVYPNLAKSRDKTLSRKVTRLVIVAGAGASALLFVAAPWLVRVFAGPALDAAVPIVRLMSPYLFLAAVGPLLTNVLLVEERHRDLFPNMVVSGAFYLAALGVTWALGCITPGAVALVFVAAIAVRNADRYFRIRKYGLTDWLHAKAGASPGR